jgi:hypothetical protein
MSTLDLTPLVQPILAVTGIVMAAMLKLYVPRALEAFSERTGIVLTDQQRAQMIGAVNTAAGMIETRLDQGAISAAHVDIANDQIRAEAAAAIAAVPNAAAALGMTQDGVARMIVGKVDTAAHRLVVAVPHLTADEVAHAIIAVVRHEAPAV